MDDADLEKLTVKPGRLEPKFNRNTTQYAVLLNSGISELKIDPLTRDSNASWTVTGLGTTRSIAVTEGSCFDVCIEVTAEDGTIKHYTISVTSLSSSSAVLSAINIQGFQLSPKFSMTTYSYTCDVPSSCSSVSLLATSPDKKSNIVVVDSEDDNVLLNYGSTRIDVNVTSPDGTKMVAYVVNVSRYKLLFPVVLSADLTCNICLSALHSPISLKDDLPKQYFCESCLQLVTRSNKCHPLTGEALLEDYTVGEMDVDKELSQQIVKCPLGCGEDVKMRLLADHMVNQCSSSFAYIEKVDNVLFGKLKDDDSYKNTDCCSSCARAVPINEREFHADHICISKHQYEFAHKVETNKWQSTYQDMIVLESGVDALAEGMKQEAECLKIREQCKASNTAVVHLEKACQYYCHGISDKPKDHQVHYRLAVVLEEMHYLKDIFGIEVKKKEKAVLDEGDEFQTEESMLDDIRALTEQCGFGSNASTSDQLKALDQEYHFLLEQGQSERADYVQKLYAFKQKKQHQSGNVSLHQNQDSLFGKACIKYMDAASIDQNNALYHLNVGRCLLKRGDYDEAVKWLRYSLALKPAYMEAR